MQRTMNICFSADRKYAPYLGVTITSIVANRGADDLFNFYILDGGISTEDKEKIARIDGIDRDKIEYLSVDVDTFKSFPIGSGPHISTFYRLLLPDLLPDSDKALYLDCDIIVKGSLSELYDIDLSNYYFAGVPDITEAEQTKRLGLECYMNAGVTLFNLKRWREDSIFEKMRTLVADDPSRIVLADQDLLNIVLQGGGVCLDSRWNRQIYTNNIDISDAVVVHYICDKPWRAGYSLEHRDLYFNYLKSSRWSDLYYTIKERERSEVITYLAFNIIPIVSIFKGVGRWQISLFGVIPLCRVDSDAYIKRYKLLGFITMYKIKHKQGYVKHYLFGLIRFLKYKD